MALAPFLTEIFQNQIFAIVSVSGAFTVGTLQGWILGKAILYRFPRLQNHAKILSTSLFFLFLANAILSVPRFASPEKIEITSLFEASSKEEIASFLFTLLGVNTGFLAVLAISVTIVSLILLRLTHLHGLQKSFVVFFSILVLVLTIISRFTDLTPSSFEVFLYFLYQLGITIGIVTGTARKIKKQESNV